MEESRWADIYRHLKSEGFDVYSPNQKTGLCLTPYVVVKSREVIDTGVISSVQALYDILCYIPKDSFSKVEIFVAEVSRSMDKMFPLIRPVNTQTEPFYDGTVQGYMISIQYLNYRKMIRR